MKFPRRILIAVAVITCGVTSLHSQSPEVTRADILRTFKTIYVQSRTPLAKPNLLAGELQENFDKTTWNLSISSNLGGADVVVEIDHQPGWFYYTYSMTHLASGLVLAVGRVDAWDGKNASIKVAREIMKQIAKARNPPKENEKDKEKEKKK